MDATKYLTLVVPLFLFSGAVGTAFWRITRVEKEQEKDKEETGKRMASDKLDVEKRFLALEERYEKRTMALQVAHKEELSAAKSEIAKLRADHEQQFKKLETVFEDQRKAALDNFKQIDNKVDAVKEGIWALKETLARMGAPQYPPR